MTKGQHVGQYGYSLSSLSQKEGLGQEAILSLSPLAPAHPPSRSSGQSKAGRLRGHLAGCMKMAIQNLQRDRHVSRRQQDEDPLSGEWNQGPQAQVGGGMCIGRGHWGR